VTLFTVAVATAQAQVPEKRTYTYKTVEGLQIQADVYRSAGDEVTPAILWIHGGALIFGSRNWLEPSQVEKYLDAGFTVIAIDYRLAPQVKIDAIIEDLEDAYLWVRTQGPRLFRIDPDRIAVVGRSAGGYLTLMAGFRLSPRPTALVSFYGYGDIAGAWISRPDPFYNQRPVVSEGEARMAVDGGVMADAGSMDRAPFYLHTRQLGIWQIEVVGSTPETDPGRFDALCPIRNVTLDYPPTLLLHGDQDTDVPHEQSVLMAAELERQGVPSELISLAGFGHVFDAEMEDRDVAAAFERVLSFLREYLKR
jgi:acetyl esterase/lipase